MELSIADLIVAGLFIGLIIVLSSSFAIAAESERFAVFTLGHFMAFKGPGLIFVTPNVQRAVKLRIGDVGEMLSSEFARFGPADIPVKNIGSLRQGEAVRIDGFDGVEPRLVASPLPPKTMCPKCGHQF